MKGSIFSKVGGVQPAAFFKNELLEGFSFILRNKYFKEHLSVANTKSS